MRETIEFRITEERARQFLEPDLGVPLGEALRKVVLPLSDPQVRHIQELEQEHRRRGGVFFTYWRIHRSYSAKELQAAELLNLAIRSYFEPPGTLCGTGYDESVACAHCGSGARQVTPLTLDTRRIPKGKDFAQTIAGELVVSLRLADALVERGIRGADYQPVLHHGRHGAEPSDWRQLVITSKPARLHARTVAGVHPFELDAEGEHRCPNGHLAGLNQISELTVERDSLDTSDWWRTDKLFGVRRGELRPEPRLLISQKLREVLVKEKAKGFALEVAHAV
ncbi:hypothetical protein [Stigmatella aurantiaca]|nr:hypothetical protein [Stigmatella aurantiaca]